MNDHTNEAEDRLMGAEEMASEIAAPSLPLVAVQAPFATPDRLERARELVRAFAVAHLNSVLYPMTHPLVVQSLAELASAAGELIGDVIPSATISVYKGTLFVENQVFPEESVTYRKLIEELSARGMSSITFLPGVTPQEAGVLVDLLNDTAVFNSLEGRRFLESRGVFHIAVAETTALDSADDEERGRELRTRAKATYDAGLVAMRDVETQAKLGKVVEVGPLQKTVGDMIDHLLKDPATVLGLTAIKGHDDYTLNHAVNVCILALSLGSALGLDEAELKSLGLCALLYDIGKVRVPSEILSKQGPLTAEEWRNVKRHAEEGADLLKRLRLADKMPMVVAYEHHQRYDKMGYPDPQGAEQHLFSKIVAVCEAYDAMTTLRPFRREIRPDKALSVLMQGRGKAYDPQVTKGLVTMLGIYPMGAVVKLDDASVAVVYRVNSDDLVHPRVKVLIDVAGRWRETPEIIDLRLVDVQTGESMRSIAECVSAIDEGIDDVWQYL